MSSDGVLTDRTNTGSSQDRAGGDRAALGVTFQALAGRAGPHTGPVVGAHRPLVSLAAAWLTVLMLRVRAGRRG